MKETLGLRIKSLRKSLELSQKELGNKIHLPQTAISKIESNKQPPSSDQIKALAKALQTNSDYLLGIIDNSESKYEMNTLCKIPIVGTVAAGKGEFADNNVIGYELLPTKWVSDGQHYVLLKVKGDSMYPEFKENDLLLVRPQPTVNSGSYAVVLIDNDNGVVKKVSYTNDYIELNSVNPMYAPLRFEGCEMSRIRIFGLVKKCIRNI